MINPLDETLNWREMMELFDVVMKLIGPVYPIGETYSDSESMENLKALTALTERLLDKVHEIQFDYKDSYQASMRAASAHCDKFLDSQNIQK